MELRSHLPRVFWTGIVLIVSAFISGIGADIWESTRNFLSSQFQVISQISFPWIIIQQTIMIILPIIGVSLVGLSILKNRRTGKSPRIPYKGLTMDSKLDELIQELDSFVKKWKVRSMFKTGYRREIEIRTMWRNVRKIREHSQEIHKKIRPLRSIKIGNANTILDSVADLADQMAELGRTVESIFFDIRSIKRTDTNEPKRVEGLPNTGDRICDDINTTIVKLEGLRRHI